MLSKLSGYNKALVGGVVGFAGWLASATATGGISPAEWGTMPLAVLVAAGAVAVVPNSE